MSNLTETEIANRALQRVGAQRIGKLDNTKTLWTEDSKNADEIRACYHMLRRAELRRNCWRFSIRRVALRPMGTNSKIVTFGAWASGTTYALNDVVLGSDGLIYQSKTSSNVGHDPTGPDYTNWGLYFGSVVASEFVTTWGSGFTYALGDHSVGSDGVVYVSLAAGNLNHNPVGDGGVHWAVAANQTPADTTEATDTSFYAGELVFIGGTVYCSKINSNTDTPPTSNWMTFTTAPSAVVANFVYPIGAGPYSDTTTRNVYQLPNGFLREAPQMPKAGSTHPLGAPSALGYKDWEYNDNYIVTLDTGVTVFRFSADIADATQFDPMFAEGFASRIAFEICEPLTQSTAKLQAIASEYKQFMTEARAVNGIEQGPTEAPEDNYVSDRL